MACAPALFLYGNILYARRWFAVRANLPHARASGGRSGDGKEIFDGSSKTAAAPNCASIHTYYDALAATEKLFWIVYAKGNFQVRVLVLVGQRMYGAMRRHVHV